MKSIHLKKLSLLLLLFTASSLFAETVGKASWYGEEFHGKKTASGELFNMYDYTASHPSYPFGTMLKVTNLSNNKSIKVRVIDRGSYSDNGIIDISFQSAKEIGMVESGVADVKVEKIDMESSTPTEMYPLDLNESILDIEPVINTSVKSQKLKLDEDQVIVQRSESKSEDKKIIKLQIASFLTKENAEKFMEYEKNDYNMEIEKLYVQHLDKTFYKVVILCESSMMLQDIRDSKKYNGAYILTKNVD